MTEENKEDKGIKDNTFSLLFRSDKGIKKSLSEERETKEQEQEIGKSAILTFNNNNYLRLISNNDDIIVLYDDKFQAYRYDVITLIFSLVFLVLLAVYIFIIRKLKPLRRLKRQRLKNLLVAIWRLIMSLLALMRFLRLQMPFMMLCVKSSF